LPWESKIFVVISVKSKCMPSNFNIENLVDIAYEKMLSYTVNVNLKWGGVVGSYKILEDEGKSVTTDRRLYFQDVLSESK